MSFPAYPAYKDSGVEWLGQVPEHWTVIALKWLSPVFRGASPRPIDDPIYFEDDGEFGWVRIADVTASPDGYLYETTQKLSALGSSLSVKLDPGELFLSIAGSVGKPCITKIKACIHDGFVYFPLLSIDQRLLYRAFEAGHCFGGLGKMGTQLNLNTDTVGGICIAVPPASEVSKVLAFLDYETARIDALIEEQQRLIELLKEKRQAVISHAVTKGLDSMMPMKDSEVEWLGRVPAHWKVLALKWRARVRSGDGISPLLIEAEPTAERVIPVVGGNGTMGYTDQSNTSPPFIAIGRVGALCGNVHRIEELTWVSDNALILDVQKESFDLAYLEHVLRTRNLNEISDKSAQPLITGSKVTGQYLPCPCLAEQQTIASFVDSTLAQFDALTLRGEQGIALLKERRSALISAAVTGKIDVRGWQPPARAQAPIAELEEAV